MSPPSEHSLLNDVCFLSVTDWSADEAYGDDKIIHPSEEYIAMTRETCLQQVVLGGYRLSTVLKGVAEAIRFALDCGSAKETSRHMPVNWGAAIFMKT